MVESRATPTTWPATSRTDAKSHTTAYGYDADSWRTSVLSPTGQRWTTSYDPAGNVSSETDGNGNATPAPGDGTTSYTYDRAGRLIGIDYSDATPDVSFAYDAAGNRTQMTDGAGTETRDYDAADRLLSVARGQDTFSYLYDQAGNVTRRTYPGGGPADYAYDDESRLASVTSAGHPLGWRSGQVLHLSIASRLGNA